MNGSANVPKIPQVRSPIYSDGLTPTATGSRQGVSTFTGKTMERKGGSNWKPILKPGRFENCLLAFRSAWQNSIGADKIVRLSDRKQDFLVSIKDGLDLATSVAVNANVLASVAQYETEVRVEWSWQGKPLPVQKEKHGAVAKGAVSDSEARTSSSRQAIRCGRNEDCEDCPDGRYLQTYSVSLVGILKAERYSGGIIKGAPPFFY